ncbi:cytotoxic translational repressor of toxin-antitoxin stability system [Desulfosporosinus acidiphilus SJ4]|uniref:Cytotoxic translational repressor of toxin-antitoxin stability system n=1 Tax=Desulfosporosinus acidiphilus (strain DSM 22704 / JCM 16185 / SJ4) TaxID=646529 RepID=I4DAZ6_DESAJ|nr:type II toxin-antitoxin system RelE/ParE family toxin [Desulfosporosinus acidiphilus]AFM42970.1 cytotoxic translational repressor of toxin-antitoxin stability system [Desulfosporosinus acidiphilus SJ4]
MFSSEEGSEEIQQLEKRDFDQIWRSIRALAQDPYANATHYISQHWLKIRFGDFRVAFDIDEQGKTITIRKVGHRREFYA